MIFDFTLNEDEIVTTLKQTENMLSAVGQFSKLYATDADG